MFDCPECGKRGVSPLRKLFLGSAAFTKCRSCGTRISVSNWSLLAGTPFIAAFVAWMVYRSLGTLVAVFATGIFFIVIHQWFVPLVRKPNKGKP